MHDLMKKLFVLVVIVAGIFFWRSPRGPVLLPPPVSSATPSYEFSPAFDGTVAVFDENIQYISHIEITPDGNFMLVGTLPGTIWVYHKTEQGFVRQKDPFFTVKTAQPGWPPQEAGLTGIALGADFETSGDVFLLYSFAFEKGSFRNRVMRVRFTKRGQQIVGTNPREIFEAATPGTGAHQIQDGVGVLVNNAPHVLFTIGDGFVGARAPDPSQQAGKIMLIDRDGNPAHGERPFEDGKVQALGIRNAPAIAVDPTNGKIAIGDTGPSNFDRLLYGALYDAEGNNTRQLSFNWDGTEESLQKDAPDLYDDDKEMILYRWAPTETAVNIAWRNDEQVLVVLFGRTGEPGNVVGKKILLGRIRESTAPAFSFEPFIIRRDEAADTLGHPLGLAVDPQTGDIYFGDILEGLIYQAKGGEVR